MYCRNFNINNSFKVTINMLQKCKTIINITAKTLALAYVQ